MKTHHYTAFIDWTGSRGTGTTDYKKYDRDYSIRIDEKKQVIRGSADPAFLGDSHRFNPEEMLLASISSCHMLWYLHLCADKGIVVMDYSDSANGTMIEYPEGGGKFEKVVLRPIVTVKSQDMVDQAHTLHIEANQKCFIANSCNFPVTHEVTVNVVV